MEYTLSASDGVLAALRLDQSNSEFCADAVVPGKMTLRHAP